MSTVAVTRTIDAPVEAVWRVVTDLPGRAGWLSAVRRAELRTPGPFRTGTVWAETRTAAGGDTVTEEFRVLEAVELERFVVTSPGIGADYRMTYTFRPHRGGTHVTVTQDGRPVPGLDLRRPGRGDRRECPAPRPRRPGRGRLNVQYGGPHGAARRDRDG
jgi:uncharacterized protein YndB with AHSA1/START domain